MATIQVSAIISTWSTEVVRVGQNGTEYRHIEVDVMEANSQYPQQYKLQLRSDNYAKVTPFLQQNAVVTFKCNLQGRNWTNNEGKIMNFLTLDVFDVVQQPAQNAPQTPVQNATTQPAPVTAQPVQPVPVPAPAPAHPANTPIF